MAGLIKAALALYHKVLPPMICEEVNPNLELEKTPFYINTEARPWIHGQTTPRRAGVNAFGFGGINAHAVLEEYRTTTDVLAVQESAPQMHAQWPTELVLLTGQSWSAVTELGSKVQTALANNPDIQLNQLAMALAQESDGPYKIAILATSSSDLQSKLAIALEKQNDPQRHRLFGL
jgi:acyl transferase domain-containing protein